MIHPKDYLVHNSRIVLHITTHTLLTHVKPCSKLRIWLLSSPPVVVEPSLYISLTKKVMDSDGPNLPRDKGYNKSRSLKGCERKNSNGTTLAMEAFIRSPAEKKKGRQCKNHSFQLLPKSVPEGLWKKRRDPPLVLRLEEVA